MNDLRAKLAALFRRCTSPDVSDDEAAAALKEFRSLGATRAEVDAAFAVQAKPTTVQQVTHAPPAAAPANKAYVGFVNPIMPYGKYGPTGIKRRPGGWLLTDLVKCDRTYLEWLLADSDPPPKPWIRKQVEMALAGAVVEAVPPPTVAPAPVADNDDDVPF